MIVLFYRILKKEQINLKYEFLNFFSFACGSASYFVYMYIEAGSAFAAFEAQKNFIFGNSILNSLNPLHFVSYLLSPVNGIHSYTNSLVDKIFIIFSLIGFLFLLQTKRIIWIVLYIMLLYPVASMGTGGSFVRFSLLLIPFFSLSIWENFSKNSNQIYFMIVSFLFFQIYFLHRFTLNMWVG